MFSRLQNGQHFTGERQRKDGVEAFRPQNSHTHFQRKRLKIPDLCNIFLNILKYFLCAVFVYVLFLYLRRNRLLTVCFKASREYKQLHINFPLLLRCDKKLVINRILSHLELLEKLSLTCLIQTSIFQLLFVVMKIFMDTPYLQLHGRTCLFNS